MLDYRRVAQVLEGRMFSLLRDDLEAALRDGLLDTSAVTQRFGLTVDTVTAPFTTQPVGHAGRLP